jgi:hypothetical protein
MNYLTATYPIHICNVVKIMKNSFSIHLFQQLNILLEKSLKPFKKPESHNENIDENMPKFILK